MIPNDDETVGMRAADELYERAGEDEQVRGKTLAAMFDEKLGDDPANAVEFYWAYLHPLNPNHAADDRSTGDETGADEGFKFDQGRVAIAETFYRNVCKLDQSVKLDASSRSWLKSFADRLRQLHKGL
jgi:hypothetical protein